MGSIQKERDAGRPLAGEHDRLSVAKNRNKWSNR
jgi:hypothetical protein